MNNALGLAHFWELADGVIRFTAYLLLGMSVVSWFLILWKTWGWWRVRRASKELDAFWSAPTIEVAIAALKPVDAEGDIEQLFNEELVSCFCVFNKK